MLKSEQSIITYDRGFAYPDRLSRQKHGQYFGYGEEMLTLYRQGIGRTRSELHESINRLFRNEPDCDPRRIRAFCRILDDAGEYDVDREGRTARFRFHLFSSASALHAPSKGSGEKRAREDLARMCGLTREEIESALYADRRECHLLQAFTGYTDAEALLARYNVAQIQACLYRAEGLRIMATRDFKTILRCAKLARLLHDILRLGPSKFRIDLSGPAAVLRHTCRYGVNMARFLPGLLACRGWKLLAALKTPWGAAARFRLSHEEGLMSHLPAPRQYDSLVEENFARAFGQRRSAWRLYREAEILHEGQTAFVPDFVMRHEKGCEVCFEIVGFWTEDYLTQKKEVLKRFRHHRILIALPDRSRRRDAQTPANVILYKNAPEPEAVVEALERMRRKGPCYLG